MNVARRSDGLLPQAPMLDLVSEVAEAPCTRDTLVGILRARGLGTAGRVLNSLELLKELGIVEEAKGIVRLSGPPAARDGIRERIRDALVSRYCDRLKASSLGSCIQQGATAGQLRLDSVQLPFRELGYPYLLLEFGVAIRGDGGRAWAVAPDAVGAFLDVLKVVNTRIERARPFPLSALRDLNARIEAAGEAAEAFALGYEIRRLRGHWMLDQVRRISEKDTGAGYDIASFDDQYSLLHDRFIEVKGYAERRAFHWSPVEMAAAQELRARYWLYLVDRSRMDEQGYAPEMISDPYAYFIEENPAGWSMEATGHLFSAPEPAPAPADTSQERAVNV